MSNKDSDEVHVTIENKENIDDEKPEESVEQEEEPEESVEQLKSLLTQEKEKSSSYEEKLKHALADYQNLERKSKSDIENGINAGIDKFMLDFLTIYDDFVRAKNSYEKNNVDTKGLDSILKNMDSLLKKYNITPIDALGEIFDPRLHEALSIKNDPNLDDGTVIQEIRKGYISHNRVIRPTLVEISKKSERDDEKWQK